MCIVIRVLKHVYFLMIGMVRSGFDDPLRTRIIHNSIVPVLYAYTGRLHVLVHARPKSMSDFWHGRRAPQKIPQTGLPLLEYKSYNYFRYIPVDG